MRGLAIIFLALGLLTAPPALAQPQMRATAERPILLIAQLISGKIEGDFSDELRPLKTMKEIEGFLRSKGVRYQRVRFQFDTRTGDPRMAQSIAGLPPGEIFVMPRGENLLFNQVVRSLTPEEAELIENW